MYPPPTPQFLYGFSLFQRMFFFRLGGGAGGRSPPLAPPWLRHCFSVLSSGVSCWFPLFSFSVSPSLSSDASCSSSLSARVSDAIFRKYERVPRDGPRAVNLPCSYSRALDLGDSQRCRVECRRQLADFRLLHNNTVTYPKFMWPQSVSHLGFVSLVSYTVYNMVGWCHKWKYCSHFSSAMQCSMRADTSRAVWGRSVHLQKSL